jgi:hypothetical protein
MDKLSAERRSANMRQIRSKNTAPEVVLRSLVHRLGYRFRLIERIYQGNLTLFFLAAGKSFFCTDVFGISTMGVVKVGCQAHTASIGNRSSQGIENRMPPRRRH